MADCAQVEVQLGHLCNNRCVFCVSGHLTHLKSAPLLDPETIKARIRDARAAGQKRLTLLGGEPTVQPFFMDVLRYAVGLGFDEIVVFSNGSRTAHPEIVDEILATGGRFEFRFSFQGATREAHERTTRRKGSFAQLEASLANTAARGQKTTVNMCVVRPNYESVDQFPALLMPHGVRQLHLDMVHPDDMPEVPDLGAVLVRYSDLVGPLERMVRGFPDGFDVNIGNLPYCIAPHLAPWIHHGGQETWTATVDGAGELVPSWNKYERKQRNTVKPDSCRACVFDDKCTGVFRQYADLYGLDELQPVSAERLRELDPGRRVWSVHARAVVARALEGLPSTVSGDESHIEIRVGALVVRLERRGGGAAATDLFGLHIVAGDASALPVLRDLWARLVRAGARSLHPPGEDAFTPATPRVAARLARLRAAVPFAPLTWTELHVAPDRTEVVLEHGAERAVVWLAEKGAGYRVEAGGASPELTRGLRAVMVALGRLPVAA